MYRVQIEFCGDRNKSRDIQTYPSAALTAEPGEFTAESVMLLRFQQIPERDKN